MFHRGQVGCWKGERRERNGGVGLRGPVVRKAGEGSVSKVILSGERRFGCSS